MKYLLLIPCGVALISFGAIAGIVLYVANAITDSLAWIILGVMVSGMLLSGMGIALVDIRKIINDSNRKKNGNNGNNTGI